MLRARDIMNAADNGINVLGNFPRYYYHIPTRKIVKDGEAFSETIVFLLPYFTLDDLITISRLSKSVRNRLHTEAARYGVDIDLVSASKYFTLHVDTKLPFFLRNIRALIHQPDHIQSPEDERYISADKFFTLIIANSHFISFIRLIGSFREKYAASPDPGVLFRNLDDQSHAYGEPYTQRGAIDCTAALEDRSVSDVQVDGIRFNEEQRKSSDESPRLGCHVTISLPRLKRLVWITDCRYPIPFVFRTPALKDGFVATSTLGRVDRSLDIYYAAWEVGEFISNYQRLKSCDYLERFRCIVRCIGITDLILTAALVAIQNLRLKILYVHMPSKITCQHRQMCPLLLEFLKSKKLKVQHTFMDVCLKGEDLEWIFELLSALTETPGRVATWLRKNFAVDDRGFLVVRNAEGQNACQMISPNPRLCPNCNQNSTLCDFRRTQFFAQNYWNKNSIPPNVAPP